MAELGSAFWMAELGSTFWMRELGSAFWKAEPGFAFWMAELGSAIRMPKSTWPVFDERTEVRPGLAPSTLGDHPCKKN
jgi:hypothetical protein